MPPDSVWCNKFNKSEVHLNLRGIGWKNFMSQCLLETDIYKGSEKKNEYDINFDANDVMNLRRKMVKKFEDFPTPREQVQIAALKILREENHNRLLRKKEGKLVEKEIVKLRQILENRRDVIRKKLQETNENSQALLRLSKKPKFHGKLPKSLEHWDSSCKINTWLAQTSYPSLETKINRKILTEDLKTITKTQHSTKNSEQLSCRKGSLIEGETNETKRADQFWEEIELKDERVKGLFEIDVESSTEELQDGFKEIVNITSGQKNCDRVNQKSLGQVLGNWKNFAQNKNWTKKKIDRSKIEKFLLKLQETKLNEEKQRTFKVSGRAQKHRLCEKKEKNEDTNEKLKKLIQEVKLSQKEAQQKLQGAKRNYDVNTKFLLRMEERIKERTKRRKEFEERKLKFKEAKENLQRLREEEQKQMVELEKRRKLEETKEKRREEKQKKQKQKEKREKLKVNIGLAVSYYRIFLLRNYALRPWLELMRTRKLQQQQAKYFFEKKVKAYTLLTWREIVRKEIDLKVSRALEFYEKVLKKNYLFLWEEYTMDRKKRSQAAMDWFDFKITEKALKKWLQFTKSEQSENKIREEIAVSHYQRKLQIKYLQMLQNYPELKKLDQAKENRKRKWRQKVKEILPDFEPVSIFESF